MLKLVILDRDGVINYDSPEYIKSPEEWRAIPGSLDAIKKLNQAGITVAVATNQSGVGRGYYDVNTLNKIHQKMIDELHKIDGHIDYIAYCPHTPDDHCECRKPKPGLLIEISKKLKINLKNALMIGDSPRDVEAAEAVNCRGILIDKNNENKLLEIIDELLLQELAIDVKKFTTQNRLLKKAIGDNHTVCDLTAGLGRDAYFLISQGYDVEVVERSSLIAQLLRKNLSNIKKLYIGEAKDYLARITSPDVIYFDPIFPEKNKTALPQKNLRILKALVGEDNDAKEVFEVALKKAKRRVVVKRPLHGEPISDRKPDIVFKGKTVRFDVYLVS